jgi:hypothetical protein
VKIASWNVNSLNVRLPHLQEWLRLRAPDVVALQETKLEDAKFPEMPLLEMGYRSVFSGQKTYNGVAILSRAPIADVQLGIPGFEDEQRRAIAATVDGVRIVNLYVVNGQTVGCDKYDYKLRWIDAVHGWLSDEAGSTRNWWCWAISTSRPKTATCTIRCAGTRTASSPPPPSALRSRACWAWACTTASACTTRKPGTSAGGITAPPACAATWACASTWRWSAKA